MASVFLNLIRVGCLWSAITALPVPKKMVDMTYVFDETTLYYPELRPFKLATVINETVDNSYWLFMDDYFSSTHAGTHMDAPAHFSPGGRTIDQIPVSDLFGPAAVIDITERAEIDRDAEVQVEDLQDWERKAGRSLDGHIVLMRSGWGKRWGDRTVYMGTDTEDETQMHSPGFSARAARWLVENRRALGVGVDSVSLDKGQGSRDGFPAHVTLLGAGLWGLENVANVEQIPVSGAMLAVLPMKIGKGSGAPVRIVATFTDPGSRLSSSRVASFLGKGSLRIEHLH